MTALEEHTAHGLTIEQTVVAEDYTVGCLSIPNKDGDLRIMWDSRNKDEVKAAKKQFDEMRQKGYAAYKAEGKDGRRGDLITEFDKKVERIVMFRNLAGG